MPMVGDKGNTGGAEDQYARVKEGKKVEVRDE